MSRNVGGAKKEKTFRNAHLPKYGYFGYLGVWKHGESYKTRGYMTSGMSESHIAASALLSSRDNLILSNAKY